MAYQNVVSRYLPTLPYKTWLKKVSFQSSIQLMLQLAPVMMVELMSVAVP